jgi:hypothetical protein
MDLSKLSDADLDALERKDMSALSDTALNELEAAHTSSSEYRQKPGIEGKSVKDLQQEWLRKEGSLMTRAKHDKAGLIKDQLYDIPRTVAEAGTAIANSVKMGAEGIATGLTGDRSYVRNSVPLQSPLEPSNLSRYVLEPGMASLGRGAEQGAEALGLPEGMGQLAVETAGNILPAFGLKGVAKLGASVPEVVRGGAVRTDKVPELRGLAQAALRGESIPELAKDVQQGMAQHFLGFGFPAESVEGKIKSGFTTTPEAAYATARSYAEKNIPIILKGKTGTAKTFKQLKESAPTAVNGMEHIVDEARAGKLNLEGESRVPKSLMETVDAQDQTLSNIAERMHQEVSATTGQGLKADLTPLATELHTFSELPEVSIGNASAANAAKTMAYKLEVVGSMTPTQIADTLTGINAQLKTWYKSGQLSDIGNVVVLDNTARALRKALNGLVEEGGIAGHADLRKAYGDVAASREAMVKAAQANQSMPAHMGFGEVLSAAEMAHGVATLSPSTTAAGGMLLGAKKLYKYYASPDRRIKAAFEKLDKTKPVTPPRPEIPPPKLEAQIPVGEQEFAPNLANVEMRANRPPGFETTAHSALPPEAVEPNLRQIAPAELPIVRDKGLEQSGVQFEQGQIPPAAENTRPPMFGGQRTAVEGTTLNKPADLISTGLTNKKGSAGVKEAAMKLGVSAVVLTTWLLADEKKKRELARNPAYTPFL